MGRTTSIDRRSHSISIVVLLLLGRGAHAAPPPAEDLRAELDRARVCWAALDPECAESALQSVRAHLADLPPEQQIEALRLSAEVALSSEQAIEAHDHLLALLALDPRFAPPAWPGPWLEALARARAAAPDRLPPELTVTVPAEVRPKTNVAIEVRAHDPGGVARCELVLADGTRVPLLSADGVVFRGELPKARVRAPELLVHIEASDRAGNLARWPTVAAHRIAVTAPIVKDPPLTSRWWFWTAIGAVVIGGTIGLVVALDGAAGAAGESVRQGDILLVLEFP